MEPREASIELLNNLERARDIVIKLTDVAFQKEKILKKDDITALNDLVQNEEEIIAELRVNEEARKQIVASLMSDTGAKTDDVKLSDIIECVKSPDIKARLSDISSKLNEETEKLMSQNEINRALINSKIEYTNFMINLMYMAGKEEGFNSYDPQGNKQGENESTSLLDYKV
ncbi:MAG TPA: flagellar protein FlgN [Bacillota bacterium]|nr:flagellar protein FlgN [Clostridiales bacterium]HOQ13908.1 flagellar protein FlgN [Bacillota bacterium]